MRAAVLSAVGEPIRVEELRDPSPKEGEVLIRVAACGVCHSDLHIVKGDLPFVLPCVLGHEISGIVEALGAGVTGLRGGDRVVASFIMPCGRCDACLRGRDDMCETYFAMNRAKGTLYDGTTRLYRKDGTPVAMNMMGGLAERAVVPATDVFPIPSSLPFEESCILGCALMTAYGAVKNAGQVAAGQTVAVMGTGGVGSNIIPVARIFGARSVIAVDVREEKLAAARRLGADHAVDASKGDPVERVRALTGGKGADVAIEALGRPETVRQALLMTRDGGRTVVVGVAKVGETLPVDLLKLIRRSSTLAGSYGCRVRTDMPELIALAAAGKIDVAASVTRRFRLDEINDAYAAMERGEIVGRAIVVL
jgi:S-(hydroxymethyl)glutathione dehydrogenase/alcohol dehydrogenase